MYLTLTSPLDLHKINKGFQKLIQLHEALRTSFSVKEGRLVQIVHDTVDFTLGYLESSEQSVEAALTSFQRPFDLDSAPLFRAAVIHKQTTDGDEEFFLLYDFHHIIADGSSIKVIMDDFMALYRQEQVDPPPVRFRDYSVWMEQKLKSAQDSKESRFWLSQFENGVPETSLPLDFLRDNSQGDEGDCVDLWLEPEVCLRLSDLAYQWGVTVNLLCMAFYWVLLYKWTSYDEIPVGFNTTGRERRDLQRIVGMFVNTLVLRCKIDPGKTFRQFVSSLEQTLHLALEHRDYPFDLLVQQLGIQPESGRNPLFDTLFVPLNLGLPAMKLDDMLLEPLQLPRTAAKVDLQMDLFAENNQVCFTFNYKTGLFAKGTIQKLSEWLKEVIHELLDQPDRLLGEYVYQYDGRFEILDRFNEEL